MSGSKESEEIKKYIAGISEKKLPKSLQLRLKEMLKQGLSSGFIEGEKKYIDSLGDISRINSSVLRNYENNLETILTEGSSKFKLEKNLLIIPSDNIMERLSNSVKAEYKGQTIGKSLFTTAIDNIEQEDFYQEVKELLTGDAKFRYIDPFVPEVTNCVAPSATAPGATGTAAPGAPPGASGATPPGATATAPPSGPGQQQQQQQQQQPSQSKESIVLKIITYNVSFQAMLGQKKTSVSVACPKDKYNSDVTECLVNVVKLIDKYSKQLDFIGLQEASNYDKIVNKIGNEMKYIHYKPRLEDIVLFYKKEYILDEQIYIHSWMESRGRPYMVRFFNVRSHDICVINLHAGHNDDIYKLENYINEFKNNIKGDIKGDINVIINRLKTWDIIIFGDFNDELVSPEFKLFGRTFKGKNTIKTCCDPQLNPDSKGMNVTRAYDHIMVSTIQNKSEIETEVLQPDSPSSDHLPLFGKIEITLQQQQPNATSCPARNIKHSNILDNCKPISDGGSKKNYKELLLKIHPDQNIGCKDEATHKTQCCTNYFTTGKEAVGCEKSQIDKICIISVTGNNGNNACWINSVIYAFVSNKSIFNRKKLDKLRKFIELKKESTLSNKYDNIYNNIYNKLFEFQDNVTSTQWDNRKYEEIYNILSKTNTLKDNIPYGQYNNPLYVFDVFLKSITKNVSARYAIKYEPIYANNLTEFNRRVTENEDNNKYTLISFVKSDDKCTKSSDYGHFVSASRVSNDEWIYTDMLIGGTSSDYKKLNDLITDCDKIYSEKGLRNVYICIFVRNEVFGINNNKLCDSDGIIDIDTDTEFINKMEKIYSSYRTDQTGGNYIQDSKKRVVNAATNVITKANIVDEIAKQIYVMGKNLDGNLDGLTTSINEFNKSTDEFNKAVNYFNEIIKKYENQYNSNVINEAKNEVNKAKNEVDEAKTRVANNIKNIAKLIGARVTSTSNRIKKRQQRRKVMSDLKPNSEILDSMDERSTNNAEKVTRYSELLRNWVDKVPNENKEMMKNLANKANTNYKDAQKAAKATGETSQSNENEYLGQVGGTTYFPAGPAAAGAPIGGYRLPAGIKCLNNKNQIELKDVLKDHYLTKLADWNVIRDDMFFIGSIEDLINFYLIVGCSYNPVVSQNKAVYSSELAAEPEEKRLGVQGGEAIFQDINSTNFTLMPYSYPGKMDGNREIKSETLDTFLIKTNTEYFNGWNYENIGKGLVYNSWNFGPSFYTIGTSGASYPNPSKVEGSDPKGICHQLIDELKINSDITKIATGTGSDLEKTIKNNFYYQTSLATPKIINSYRRFHNMPSTYQLILTLNYLRNGGPAYSDGKITTEKPLFENPSASALHFENLFTYSNSPLYILPKIGTVSNCKGWAFMGNMMGSKVTILDSTGKVSHDVPVFNDWEIFSNSWLNDITKTAVNEFERCYLNTLVSTYSTYDEKSRKALNTIKERTKTMVEKIFNKIQKIMEELMMSGNPNIWPTFNDFKVSYGKDLADTGPLFDSNMWIWEWNKQGDDKKGIIYETILNNIRKNAVIKHDKLNEIFMGGSILSGLPLKLGNNDILSKKFSELKNTVDTKYYGYSDAVSTGMPLNTTKDQYKIYSANNQIINPSASVPTNYLKDDPLTVAFYRSIRFRKLSSNLLSHSLKKVFNEFNRQISDYSEALDVARQEHEYEIRSVLRDKARAAVAAALASKDKDQLKQIIEELIDKIEANDQAVELLDRQLRQYHDAVTTGKLSVGSEIANKIKQAIKDLNTKLKESENQRVYLQMMIGYIRKSGQLSSKEFEAFGVNRYKEIGKHINMLRTQRLQKDMISFKKKHLFGKFMAVIVKTSETSAKYEFMPILAYDAKEMPSSFMASKRVSNRLKSGYYKNMILLVTEHKSNIEKISQWRYITEKTYNALMKMNEIERIKTLLDNYNIYFRDKLGDEYNKGHTNSANEIPKSFKQHLGALCIGSITKDNKPDKEFALGNNMQVGGINKCVHKFITMNTIFLSFDSQMIA